MGWTDDDRFSTPAKSRRILSVSGGGRAQVGDHYTLRFEGDGEIVDTVNGEQVAFDAELVDASFQPAAKDEPIEEGPVRLMTDSKPFLAGTEDAPGGLKEHEPVGGKTIRVTTEGTGFDSAFSFMEVGDGPAPDADGVERDRELAASDSDD